MLPGRSAGGDLSCSGFGRHENGVLHDDHGEPEAGPRVVTSVKLSAHERVPGITRVAANTELIYCAHWSDRRARTEV